jgi:hypothetical protein
VSDQRRDYGAAGCASGCRDTLAGASVLIVLAAVALVRVVQVVRRRRSDQLLDLLGSATPETAPRGPLEDRLLALRNETEARPMPDVTALIEQFGGRS